MRYLSVDLGDKRTGLAVGDDDPAMIHPLRVLDIPRGDALVAAVVAAAREHDADVIVVGLPLNMDGSEGPRAVLTRSFGDGLAAACDCQLDYQDERLTSAAAEELLSGSGMTHGEKRRRRDAIAAAEILGDYLVRGSRDPRH